jgi:hypothetical protein
MLWQLEYVLPDSSIVPSPVWGFQTQSFADLIVLDDINVPLVSFSGNSVEIGYSVSNIGNETSSVSHWLDCMYLSTTTSYSSATLVAAKWQYRILSKKDGYSETLSFNLRDDQVGLFYVFINTDCYLQENDFDFSNNIHRALTPLQVTLTPPPNLVVSSIRIQSQTFSDQEITVRFTVANIGLGMTKASSWNDRVEISNGEYSQTLKIVAHYGALYTQDTYMVETSILIPHGIYGNYSIIIQTDCFSQVFELNNKDDNSNETNIEIIVSPPPDLTTYSLKTDKLIYYTNELLLLNYTVKNVGPAVTYESYWLDLATVSDVTSRVNVKSQLLSYYSKLMPGENYSQITSFSIDQQIKTGTYEVCIQIDVYSNVFEYTWKENNKKCANVSIVERLSDLVLSTPSISSLRNTVNGNYLQIDYQVTNKGQGTTGSPRWFDKIFLSNLNTTQFSYDFSYINLVNYEELKANESRNYSSLFNVPNSYYGALFLIVYVNYYHDYYLNENSILNNYVIVPIQLKKCYSQLMLENATFTIQNDTLNVSWVARNIGNIDHRSWYDKILVTSNDFSQQIDIGQTETLSPNEQFTFSKSIPLSINVYGDLNISITVDVNDTGSDNRTLKKTLLKEKPLVADFAAKSIECSIRTNQTLKFLDCKWTVINDGASMSENVTWIDTIRLLSIESNQILQELSFPLLLNLKKFDGYELNKVFFISSNVNQGLKVRLYVDSSQNVVELNKENNQIESSTVNFLADKIKLNLSRPMLNTDKLQTKIPFSLKYNISNFGQLNLEYSYWSDAFFLISILPSDKLSLIKNGFMLASIRQKRSINVNTTFENSFSVSFPYLITNKAYFCVVLDVNNVLENVDQTSMFSCLTSKQIEISEGPKPNFEITQILLPNLTFSGGEIVTLLYEVLNSGNGSTDLSSFWYDAVYLSRDAFIDTFDQKISSSKISQKISSNESYKIQLNLTLPLDLQSSTYYLIVSIDNSKLIDQYDAGKNKKSTLINLKEIFSVDLSVIRVDSNKQSFQYKDSLNANWTIINNGTETVYIF